MSEQPSEVEAEVMRELSESREQRRRLRSELLNLEAALRGAQGIVEEMGAGDELPQPADAQRHAWRFPPWKS